MPSRGSYQIANREEGKAAQRDQSYRSCILALLIFLFLCIILIICLPWTKKGGVEREVKRHQSETAHHYGKEFAEETTLKITTSERTTIEISTTEESNIVTDKTILHEDRHHDFARYYEDTTTEAQTTESNEVELSTEEIGLTVAGLQSSSVFDSTSNYITTERTVYNDSFVTTSITSDAIFANNTEKTTTEDSAVENVTDTTVEGNDVVRTEKSSTFSEENTGNVIVENETTTLAFDYNPAEEETAAENVTEVPLLNRTDSSYSTLSSTVTEELASNVTEENNTIASVASENYTNTITSTTEMTTIIDLISKTVLSTTTQGDENVTITDTTTAEIVRDTENKICETGACKQIASKMLFYMNQSAYACEDFYEYACGGFEADPQTVEEDLSDRAYRRIKRQMLKEERDGINSTFAKYYKSCLGYQSVSVEERLKLVREELKTVGRFYTLIDWPDSNYPGFTDLISKLLKRHSPLMFDVVLDIDENHPNRYTLRIGPTTFEDPFVFDDGHDCYVDELTTEEGNVDLEKMYKEYSSCKNDKSKFLSSVRQALEALEIFSQNVSQYIQTTKVTLDLFVMQEFHAVLPNKTAIKEAYLTKKYTSVSPAELQKATKFINWTMLFESLFHLSVYPNVTVQVYFYKELLKGLQNLENVAQTSARELHNALLGLYAHELYRQMVLPMHRDVRDYCIRVATNLMTPEASNLYISSFSETELAYMTETISKMFRDLKDTLKIRTEEMEWTENEARQNTIQKINDLVLVLPDAAYFKQNKLREIPLTDDYFHNTMILKEKCRDLMYENAEFDASRPEQIWTFYATPFQTEGFAVYVLEFVVIPFGAVDWFTTLGNEEHIYDYRVIATLGTQIARQIAHHFDATGIHYWNKTRNSEYYLLNDDSRMKIEFDDYIQCHNTNAVFELQQMTLPATGQTVSLQIPHLTLNERLSETMGLRLAYDTLARMRSLQEAVLPWLDLNVNQLFYLAYAQTHCSKLPLTESYVSMYENERLPSRVRIQATAIIVKLIGEAWDCATGSPIIPSDEDICQVFPYFTKSGANSIPEST